ncbi:MAG TPA: hypothetical protein PLU35_04895 [Phycisphaerales bacterium]|nr:hypothetical protein [Phycisphaerales bacterium]
MIAEALAEKLLAIDAPPRILAVGRLHIHGLVCVGAGNARPIIGRAKQAASHTVRDRLPGRVWGQRCHLVRIRDETHYRATVRYIGDHASDDAAIWTHPDVRQGSRQASEAG